jgi:alpha-1,6-mannosyltransferase
MNGYVLNDVTISARSSTQRDWYYLSAIGAVTTLLTLATPFVFRTWGDNGYMAVAIPVGVLAIVAAWTAERLPASQALWLILGVAIALRIVLLFMEPMLSTDIYRYIWDGRVQAAGINPYRYIPVDAALSALRDNAIYPRIHRASYAVTIYPPVAQFFFFLVTRLSETVTMMKLALLGCEAVTVSMIFLVLRKIGRPVTRVVAYLWHPLPMWEIANSGHIDALMVALMMLGIWLAFRSQWIRGAALIALGALAKPFALLAVPPLWRPWDWKMPAVVIAVLALCYVPYLSVGAGVLGFLTTGYLSEENLVSGETVWPLDAWRELFGVVPHDVEVYWFVALLIVGGMSLMAAHRAWRSEQTILADINKLLLAALLLISPNYPWYFLGLTPFVALTGGAPVWTVSIAAVLLQEEASWGGYVPILIRKSILYGAFMLACAFTIWQAWNARNKGKRHPA